MRRLFMLLTICSALLSSSQFSWAQEKIMLVHVKTDLAKDDAQICVAYNVIWAAIEEGHKVNVLIDASAVNTYKKGWRGKDKLEGYKMPENLRKELSRQFNVSLSNIPATYGEYLNFLHEKGVGFYINGAMLVVSGISKTYGDTENISADFFTPVSISEMVNLIEQSDKYIAY